MGAPTGQGSVGCAPHAESADEQCVQMRLEEELDEVLAETRAARMHRNEGVPLDRGECLLS